MWEGCEEDQGQGSGRCVGILKEREEGGSEGGSYGGVCCNPMRS